MYTTSPRRGQSIGWVVSIVIHAAVLCLAIFYKPFRDAIFEPGKEKPAEVTASAETIEQVSQYIQDENEQIMMSRIQQMEYLLDEMEKLRGEKFDEYRQFEKDLVAEAPQSALAAQTAALAAQDSAITAQQAPSHDQALQAQAEADAAQDAARRALDVAGPAYEKPREAQQAAKDAQAKADATQLQAKNAADATDSAAQQVRRTGESLERAKIDQTKLEERVATAQRDLERLKNVEAEQKQKLAEAQNTVAATEPMVKTAQEASAKAKQDAEAARAAEKAAPKENAKEAKQAVVDADKAARLAREEQGKQERALASAKSLVTRTTESASRAAESAKKQETKVADEQAKLEKQKEKVEQLAAGLEDAKKAEETVKTTVQKAQADASQQQKEARELQAKARDLLAKAVAEGVKPEQTDQRQETQIARSDLWQKNVAELYEAARQTETKVTKSFQEFRAADLAMLRKIGLEEAVKNTHVVKPVRPNLDAELLTAKPRSVEKLEKQKEELQTAVREVDSMLALAQNLLNTAVAAEAEQQQGATVSATMTAPDRAAAHAQMEAAAAEDANAKAKDLSAMMAGKAAAPAAPPAAQIGVGSGPPRFDPKRMGAVVPARIISAAAPHGADFMAIDSWYIIGPFENPARKNINQVFPPETAVDLDAVYAGRDSQPIRWHHIQSSGPEMMPEDLREYVIYYGYTELKVDQDRDMWVAVGSDDFSKVWINDHLIWSSGLQQKSWRADEGWRKVHFKKGVNRILYRVENGWHTMAFSMIISTKPQ